MKKFAYVMAASLAAVLASCSKEAAPQEEPDVLVPFSFNAAACDSTKTSLERDSVVVWDAGDALMVWGSEQSGKGERFKQTWRSATGVTAIFAGDVPSLTTEFFALSPYDDNATYDKTSGTITSSIAAGQVLRDGSFESGKSLSFGYGTRVPSEPTGDALTFVNLCSVIKFQIPGYVTATSITISANDGKDLAGTAIIDARAWKIASVSGSRTVTLSGTSAADNVYYAVIAPGTYVGGLSFSVQTSGSSTYTCSTTRDITAAAGRIYNVGSLGLKLDGKISPTVSIAHNYSGDVLTGSTATVNMTGLGDEFAAMVKSWNISLKQGSTVFATLNASSGAMTPAGGKPYIPKGTYDLEVKYTPQSGSERTLTFTGAGTSPAPTAVKLQANYSGYTSYDLYLAKDITNANACNAETIYGIGASYAEGLSAEVYQQASGLLKDFTSKLDGTAASGDKASQSWGSHTITATASFDGVNVTCTNSRTVYITGLPYSLNPNDDDAFYAGWTKVSGSFGYNSNGGLVCWAETPEKNTTNTAWGRSPDFKIPGGQADVTVILMCRAFSTNYVSNAQLYVGNTQMASPSPLSSPDRGSSIPGAKINPLEMREMSFDTSLSGENKNVWIYATFTGTNPRIWVFTENKYCGIYSKNITIKYR